VPEPATARKEAASKISTASVGRRGALIVSSYHVVVGVLCVVFDSNVCRAHIPPDGVGSGGGAISDLGERHCGDVSRTEKRAVVWLSGI
jgi:hypothetical protein